MISTEDYLWFVDRTLDETQSALRLLGDDLATVRPDLEGANSPYGIVTHCIGVMTSWGGRFVGREVTRDRDTEFQATGSVDDLLARLDVARNQLGEDVATAVMSAAPRVAPAPDDAAKPLGRTQGGALFHLYEELVQHLGQLEITRDLLLSLDGSSSV